MHRYLRTSCQSKTVVFKLLIQMPMQSYPVPTISYKNCDKSNLFYNIQGWLQVYYVIPWQHFLI